jgi:hypothetical protein
VLNAKANTLMFEKMMNNVVEYSLGFLDGTKKGHRVFLNNLASSTVGAFKQYIDVTARMSPGALHHIYEWNQVGSPGARLYDITYASNNKDSIFFNSTFKQSKSIKNGSTVPFINKAQIMENGTPVIIKPRRSKVLVFEDNGEQVFTSNPVKVENPGGDEVQGAYEKAFDTFFNRYFTQSFLRASGILDYLENPISYKENIRAGSKQGRTKGISTGYNWIANATIGVEY